MTRPALEALVAAGFEAREAIPITEDIFMSQDVSNCYLVSTGEGALLVNTGTTLLAEKHRERFARVSPEPIHTIVFTQSHPDHIGGWHAFHQPGVETIAQDDYFRVRRQWNQLGRFYRHRNARLWRGVTSEVRNPGDPPKPKPVIPPDPVPTMTFHDNYRFNVGALDVELLAVPGGETIDSLLVWLPQRRIVFSGNVLGPMWLQNPNLYTVRGDLVRSALRYVESVDRLRSLGAELLITGHGEPIRGADEILAGLTTLRDSVEWVHDRTVEAMNTGTDLFTMMREIRPPASLAIGEAHGKVMWNIRATWEEYVGWFRYASTTELYAVPPSAVWGDLVELAGIDALVDRAARHLGDGHPLEAIHLTDIVLATEPGHLHALEVTVQALETLLERSGMENLSEVRWLETELARTRGSLHDRGTSPPELRSR